MKTFHKTWRTKSTNVTNESAACLLKCMQAVQIQQFLKKIINVVVKTLNSVKEFLKKFFLLLLFPNKYKKNTFLGSTQQIKQGAREPEKSKGYLTYALKSNQDKKMFLNIVFTQ